MTAYVTTNEQDCPTNRTWTTIKPLCKNEFAPQTDDKLILEDFANLTVKSSDNMCDYMTRIMEIAVLI